MFFFFFIYGCKEDMASLGKQGMLNEEAVKSLEVRWRVILNGEKTGKIRRMEFHD